MLVFGESDTVSHHFWMFHDPRSPRFRPGASARLGNGIRTVYARLDEALGRLLESASPDVVCVVSDHGLGEQGTTRSISTGSWLNTDGLDGNAVVGVSRGFDPLPCSGCRDR